MGEKSTYDTRIRALPAQPERHELREKLFCGNHRIVLIVGPQFLGAKGCFICTSILVVTSVHRYTSKRCGNRPLLHCYIAEVAAISVQFQWMCPKEKRKKKTSQFGNGQHESCETVNEQGSRRQSPCATHLQMRLRGCTTRRRSWASYPRSISSTCNRCHGCRHTCCG